MQLLAIEFYTRKSEYRDGKWLHQGHTKDYVAEPKFGPSSVASESSFSPLCDAAQDFM